MREKSNITMPPDERIKGRLSEQKSGEENDNFYHNWTWKASLQERIVRGCWENNNEEDKLVVGLWKTSLELEVKFRH